jgi:hypothetical protein
MRAKRNLLMFVLASFLSPGSTAYAATVRGQLVYVSNNAPAPYVAVRLNTPGRGASEFAYTGADGKYYLPNIPSGSYQLEVWRGGKAVLTTPVTVQEPDTVLSAVGVP